MIERVQQCIRQSNMEGLTIAANDLEDVASQSGLDAIAAVKPQLAQVRLEIKQAENRVLADSLARNLTSDDFLIDSEVRKRLLDRLRSAGRQH